jgi:hypothetical protein
LLIEVKSLLVEEGFFHCGGVMDIIKRILFSIAGVAVLSLLLHVGLHLIVHRAFYSSQRAKAIGATLALLGIFFLLTAYENLQEIPKILPAYTMEQVAQEMRDSDHMWAAITDGEWDCKQLAYTGQDSFVVRSNAAASVILVATFDDKISCDEIQKELPAGRISHFMERQYIYVSNHIDLASYAADTTILHICSYCGRSNSQIGIVVGFLFLVVGLLFDKVPFTRSTNTVYTAAHQPQPPDLMN